MSTVLKDTTNKDVISSQSRHAWELYTKQYQKTRMQEVIQNISTALSFTGENFKLVQVELSNKSTGGKVICVEHDGQLKISRPDLEEQCCSELVVDQMLYVKEKYNISNQAYHEMAIVYLVHVRY